MTKKTRILRVVTRLNMGGPTRHVKILLENLDRDRFDQKLVVGQVSEGEMEDEATASFIDQRVASLKREVDPIADLRAYQQIKSAISDFRPDIVHTHQAKAGFLGRLAAHAMGVGRIVHTFHGHTFAGYWGWFMKNMVLAAERFAASRSDLLLAQSPSQVEEIVGEIGCRFREKMRLVSPGVDFAAFESAMPTPSFLRSELGLTREKILVFLGRLAPIKDPAAFLRVVARVAEIFPEPIVAVIVGGGTAERERELHDLVDRLKLRSLIRWLGYRSDVPSILALGDVCVSTSINEGTPLSLLEALYCGNQVSAFAVGGIPDMLREMPGVKLVSPGDEEGLAQGIAQQLQVEVPNHKERVDLQSKLKDAFGVKRLVRDLQAVYESLD